MLASRELDSLLSLEGEAHADSTPSRRFRPTQSQPQMVGSRGSSRSPSEHGSRHRTAASERQRSRVRSRGGPRARSEERTRRSSSSSRQARAQHTAVGAPAAGETKGGVADQQSGRLKSRVRPPLFRGGPSSRSLLAPTSDGADVFGSQSSADSDEEGVSVIDCRDQDGAGVPAARGHSRHSKSQWAGDGGTTSRGSVAGRSGVSTPLQGGAEHMGRVTEWESGGEDEEDPHIMLQAGRMLIRRAFQDQQSKAAYTTYDGRFRDRW